MINNSQALKTVSSELADFSAAKARFQEQLMAYIGATSANLLQISENGREADNDALALCKNLHDFEDNLPIAIRNELNGITSTSEPAPDAPVPEAPKPSAPTPQI